MKQCPMLMYHWFRADGARSRSRSPQLEITPSRFAEQMDRLAGAGYRTVSIESALGLNATALPEKPLVLTFDDGTLDFWEHARPVLARHGFTATLFVVSGYVGGESSWDRELGEPARPLMSWEQLAELQAEGFEIGSHTHDHRPLIGLAEEEAREQLVRSRNVIGERLGRAPRFVAYPRGFYTERDKALAREAGYDGACAVILVWSHLWRSNRWELKRMTVKGHESMLRFRLRLALCGLTSFVDERSPA
jgi:peptidoglycan/xylan/chitin deacetylase (PgdA/CDA1 family)